jgi:peptidoglycan/xylan/chitin deacetylase (PgdA/CDA1 family)
MELTLQPTTAPDRNSNSAPESAADIELASPRYSESSLIDKVRRRASSRLSRYFARAPRRLRTAKPLVSFTFDDAPTSAHAVGAPLVERAGGRGVFFIATSLVGRRTTHFPIVDRFEVRDLFMRGHEIGLHGHGHYAVGSLNNAGLRDDLERNRAELADIDIRIEAHNFAYPFGLVAVERKRTLAGISSSSRSIAPGFNVGRFDAQYLRSVELANARLSIPQLRGFLEAAQRQRGWLIFTIHDVSASPSPFGCTPALLQAALEDAAMRGFEIVTIAQALARSEPTTIRSENGIF